MPRLWGMDIWGSAMRLANWDGGPALFPSYNGCFLTMKELHSTVSHKTVWLGSGEETLVIEPGIQYKQHGFLPSCGTVAQLLVIGV